MNSSPHHFAELLNRNFQSSRLGKISAAVPDPDGLRCQWDPVQDKCQGDREKKEVEREDQVWGRKFCIF